MDFVRIEHLETPPEQAVRRLKTALQQQGFCNTVEMAADEVEQRLYDVILSAIEALSKEDLAQNSEKIFVLSKAYTAIASLRRTEELELHLA